MALANILNATGAKKNLDFIYRGGLKCILKKIIDFSDINILENIWKSGSFYIFTFTQLIYSNSKHKCGITAHFP